MRFSQAGVKLISALTLIASAASCTSAPQHSGFHEVGSFIPETLRVRRPVAFSADPHAGPGGVDYRSRVLPNESWDCETIGALFRGSDLDAMRECLLSIREGQLTWRLRREEQPELELKDAAEAPACVRRLLAKIPVPREILFQSLEEGKPACFSARLDAEAEETLGVRIPFRARRSLAIRFPIADPPMDDEGLIRLLGSWAIAPLWEGSTRRLKARYVPESICRGCLGPRGGFKLLPGQAEPGSYPYARPDGAKESE